MRKEIPSVMKWKGRDSLQSGYNGLIPFRGEGIKIRKQNKMTKWIFG
jgi:hypothetical protein